MADGREQQVVLGAEGACRVAEEDTPTGSLALLFTFPLTMTGPRETDRRTGREGGEAHPSEGDNVEGVFPPVDGV